MRVPAADTARRDLSGLPDGARRGNTGGRGLTRDERLVFPAASGDVRRLMRPGWPGVFTSPAATSKEAAPLVRFFLLRSSSRTCGLVRGDVASIQMHARNVIC